MKKKIESVISTLEKVKAGLGVAGILAVLGTALFPGSWTGRLLHMDFASAKSLTNLVILALAGVVGYLFAAFSPLGESENRSKTSGPRQGHR